jgi:predicted restriction endonuclease
MPSDHMRFPASVQTKALVRQRYRCASCGLHISAIGEAGVSDHKYQERAEGHHLIPHKMAGPITVDNCVVLCRACHSNAHQGGRWRDISIYDDIAKLPMTNMIAKIAALYPHYHG